MMNERIQQLAEQASDKWMGGEFFDREKFAELLIRECADAAYQSLYEDRVFDDSPFNIRLKVMDAIKKHFGVDE
jgi:hypothetical protein